MTISVIVIIQLYLCVFYLPSESLLVFHDFISHQQKSISRTVWMCILMTYAPESSLTTGKRVSEALYLCEFWSGDGALHGPCFLGQLSLSFFPEIPLSKCLYSFCPSAGTYLNLALHASLDRRRAGAGTCVIVFARRCLHLCGTQERLVWSR